MTGLGGFLRVFWNHLPADWGGSGCFRAQSIKFVSRSRGARGRGRAAPLLERGGRKVAAVQPLSAGLLTTAERRTIMGAYESRRP